MCRFQGPGEVWIQTRNIAGFKQWLLTGGKSGSSGIGAPATVIGGFICVCFLFVFAIVVVAIIQVASEADVHASMDGGWAND